MLVIFHETEVSIHTACIHIQHDIKLALGKIICEFEILSGERSYLERMRNANM